MLLRSAQRYACEATGHREDEFVDTSIVEHPQDEIELIALIFRTVRVGADSNAHAKRLGLACQPRVGIHKALLDLIRRIAVQEARVYFDRKLARVADRQQAVFVFLEPFGCWPSAQSSRRVEVARDVRGKLLEIVQKFGDVQLP